MTVPTNYPLSWPRGYPRTESRRVAAFRSGSGGSRKLTVAEAMTRLENQVDSFTRSNRPQRVNGLIVSTNVQPTLSGRPRSNQGDPYDPGVAVMKP